MSLDKWLKSEKKEDLAKKKAEEELKKPIKKETRSTKTKTSEKKAINLIKYSLTCSKCKYKRTIVKKILSDKDKMCPKCKREMKIRKI
ncbi:MAG: hypothetical protein ACTSRI_11145 [Promethearchaeota archaeon]